MLMCRVHWRKVPARLRRDLLDAYVPGQEDRWDPTVAYLRAAEACVRSVAEKEGVDSAAVAEAVQMYQTWAEALGEPPTPQQETLL